MSARQARDRNPAPAPARRSLLPRNERREAILRSATRAFAAAGFAGTSMADIARACGVTPPIVYRHFASKEALYQAVLAQVAENLSQNLADPSAPFGIDMAALLETARSDPEGFELFWRHAAREPRFSADVDALRDEAVNNVAKALPGDLSDAQRTWSAHAVLGFAVEGTLNWLRFGDASADDRIVRASEEALRAGVRAWIEQSREQNAD